MTSAREEFPQASPATRAVFPADLWIDCGVCESWGLNDSLADFQVYLLF